jgi:hypothetical protein
MMRTRTAALVLVASLLGACAGASGDQRDVVVASSSQPPDPAITPSDRSGEELSPVPGPCAPEERWPADLGVRLEVGQQANLDGLPIRLLLTNESAEPRDVEYGNHMWNVAVYDQTGQLIWQRFAPDEVAEASAMGQTIPADGAAELGTVAVPGETLRRGIRYHAEGALLVLTGSGEPPVVLCGASESFSGSS